MLVASTMAHTEDSEPATLTFSGKGNGPIKVTDKAGGTEAVATRPIAIITPRTPSQTAQSAEDPEKTEKRAETVTPRRTDSSIDEMLKRRPKRDPGRLRTAVTPAPPTPRS